MHEHERPLTSPNFGQLSEFGIEPTKVEKPWGHELIWAADRRLLREDPVRQGRRVAVSLQFHREKDESWLIHSGARADRDGRGRRRALPRLGGRRAGAAFRYAPGHGAPRDGRSRTRTIIEVSTPQLEDVVRLEDAVRPRLEPLTELW